MPEFNPERGTEGDPSGHHDLERRADAAIEEMCRKYELEERDVLIRLILHHYQLDRMRDEGAEVWVISGSGIEQEKLFEQSTRPVWVVAGEQLLVQRVSQVLAES